MPRRKSNARKTYDNLLTFKRICRIAGITPIQRIQLIREYKKKKAG